MSVSSTGSANRNSKKRPAKKAARNERAKQHKMKQGVHQAKMLLASKGKKMWDQYMEGGDDEAEGLWDWLMTGQQEVVHAKELLYLSTRVVRVTVMCKYARIKLYDFTVMESEEKREAGPEQQASARARDAERHTRDGTFDFAPKKAKVGGWSRRFEAISRRKEAETIAAAAEDNKQYTAMTIAMQLVESGKWIRVIADTGASVSLFPAKVLQTARCTSQILS